MRIDSKLAHLLSDFCLDISKAYFIATFITPSFTNTPTFLDLIFLLTRGTFNAIVFLVLAWFFAKKVSK